VVTTPVRKKITRVTKYHKKPRNQTNPSVQREKWKRDMRLGVWNVRSLYRSGSLTGLSGN
jgi:hypothetical protein